MALPISRRKAHAILTALICIALLCVQSVYAEDKAFGGAREKINFAEGGNLLAAVIIVSAMFLGASLWIVFLVIRLQGLRVFPRREGRPVRWSAASAFAVLSFFLLLQFLLWFFYYLVSKTKILEDYLQSDMATAKASIIITIIVDFGVVGAILILVLKAYREDIAALGVKLKNLKRNVLVGFSGQLMAYPVFFLAILVVTTAVGFFGGEFAPQPAVELVKKLQVQAGGFFYLYLFFIIVLGPACEEVIFRGYLQSAVRKHFRMWPAIITTGLIFAVVHMHVYSVLPLFVLGVFLGYIFEKTGNIFAVISFHCLHNALSVCIALLLPGQG